MADLDIGDLIKGAGSTIRPKDLKEVFEKFTVGGRMLQGDFAKLLKTKAVLEVQVIAALMGENKKEARE